MARNEIHRKKVSDEFTAPGDQRQLLQQSRNRVQTLFQVILAAIESVEDFQSGNSQEKNPGRIWLQLQGEVEAVRGAKEYIKGLCEPEMEERETYPKEMHCVFLGAKSLFLDRIITDTCANVTVLEIGIISVQGRTEPVVMAQSRIQQFVRLFRNNENLPEDKEPQVKRRFKHFVEMHADKYTMDLLLLPSALKKELLNLMSSDSWSELQDYLDQELSTVNAEYSNSHVDMGRLEYRTHTPVSELTDQLDSVSCGVLERELSARSSDPFSQDRSSVKRRLPETGDRCPKKQFSLECIQVDGPITTTAGRSEVPIIDLVLNTSDTWDESVILVDDEDEDEDISSEETENKILVNFFKTMGYSQRVVEKVIRDFGQSEEPLKLLEEIEKESKKLPAIVAHPESSTKTEQLTEDLCTPVAESKPQQEVTIDPNVGSALQHNGVLTKPYSTVTSHTGSDSSIAQKIQAEGTVSKNITFVPRGTCNPPPSQHVKLPDQSKPSNRVPVAHQIPVKAHNINCEPCWNPVRKNTTLYERQVQPQAQLTGHQMFSNTIKVPYNLVLKNEPGKDLKHIIIDGSNVAMSHGLKKVFSCRGIAIAVDYFWSRGHRKITVFVPQWRTKRDPNITEQRFLKQLEGLGILSYTPARTVLGSRIASHDDRFLLHLAEKTGGVIVTNDNLREFVGESLAWMQIIKERLLPFTIVGDFFMVPDDPLGRHGPKLQEFLSNPPENRNYQITPSSSVSRVISPQHDTSVPKTIIPNTRPQLPGAFLPTDIKPQFSPVIQNILRSKDEIPTQRSYQETLLLKNALLQIFPASEQREKINKVLSANPFMRDRDALSALILD